MNPPICNHAGYIVPMVTKEIDVLMTNMKGEKEVTKVDFTLQAKCVNPFMPCGQIFNFPIPEYKPIESKIEPS